MVVFDLRIPEGKLLDKIHTYKYVVLNRQSKGVPKYQDSYTQNSTGDTVLGSLAGYVVSPILLVHKLEANRVGQASQYFGEAAPSGSACESSFQGYMQIQ